MTGSSPRLSSLIAAVIPDQIAIFEPIQIGGWLGPLTKPGVHPRLHGENFTFRI